MDYIVYDVETANAYIKGSICAIGYAVIKDHQVIHQEYSLINPLCSFSPSLVAIHGITTADVQAAPTFSDFWHSHMAQYFYNYPIFAHNAGFDLSVTEQALFDAHIPDQGIVYVDFLQICRKLLPSAPSHNLACMASWAGFDFKHHNALEDSLAIMVIANKLMAMYDVTDIESLLTLSGVCPKHTLCNEYKPHHDNHHRVSILPPVTSEDIIDHVLGGMTFCITGDLQNYSRDEARRLIELHSGKCVGAVSKKVSYLVVGDYGGKYPAGYVSEKQAKALLLAESGVPIKIISQHQFFTMLNEEAVAQ